MRLSDEQMGQLWSALIGLIVGVILGGWWL